jgi:hypothetical protein
MSESSTQKTQAALQKRLGFGRSFITAKNLVLQSKTSKKIVFSAGFSTVFPAVKWY